MYPHTGSRGGLLAICHRHSGKSAGSQRLRRDPRRRLSDPPRPQQRQVAGVPHVPDKYSLEDASRGVCQRLAGDDGVRKEDKDAGVHNSNSTPWQQFLVELYHKRAPHVFQGTNHICLSADSSTHGYHDTLGGIAYCWETNQGAYARCQHLQVGPQTDWNGGKSMTCQGWAQHLEFWGILTHQEGTIRIAVGVADGPHRVLLNHPEGSQSEWNDGKNWEARSRLRRRR